MVQLKKGDLRLLLLPNLRGFLNYMDIWHLVDRTSHKKTENFWGTRVWSPERVVPLLKEAGVVEVLYYGFKFVGLQVMPGAIVNESYIQLLLSEHDWRKCKPLRLSLYKLPAWHE